MGWYKPLNDPASQHGFMRSHSAPAPVPFRNVTDPRANNQPQPAGRKGFFSNALMPSCVTLPEGIAGPCSIQFCCKNVFAPLFSKQYFFPERWKARTARLDGDLDVHIANTHRPLAFLCLGSASVRLIKG